MGCDIHLFTEYRKDDKWLPADAWQVDTKYDSAFRIPTHLQPYCDRNYNFFAWLAGVRNGTWGEEVPVLSQPKGFPANASRLLQAESEKWGDDGHSHSWFTLKELQDGWKRTHESKIAFLGAMRQPEPAWLAMAVAERPAPKEYCAAGSGPDGPYQHYQWVQSLDDLIGQPYERLRSYLWNLKFEHNVTDKEVRAVFWFDN